jgi:hypothetical protein
MEDPEVQGHAKKVKKWFVHMEFYFVSLSLYIRVDLYILACNATAYGFSLYPRTNGWNDGFLCCHGDFN